MTFKVKKKNYSDVTSSTVQYFKGNASDVTRSVRKRVFLLQRAAGNEKHNNTPQRKQRQKAFAHSGEAFLSVRKTACPSH